MITIKKETGLFIKKYLLYIVLGALWSVSNVGYIKYVSSIFALFTLSFFMYAISGENRKHLVKFSFAFGLSAYLVHFWWMMIPMVIVMGSSLFPAYISAIATLLGILVTGFLSAFQGLYYVIIPVVSYYVARGNRPLFFITFAATGTALDYLYPKLWADYLGYSQFAHTNIMQSVDIFGISFLTLIVLISNSCFAYLFYSVHSKKSLTGAFTILSIFFTLFALLNIYGSRRLVVLEDSVRKAEKSKIALIQGNNSGLDKRDPDRSQRMINDYNTLSRSVLPEKPDLVVWPESSIPMWFGSDIEDYNYIRQFSKVPLLFGCLYRDYTDDSYNLYNALILTDEKGKKKDLYFKNKLLAFTEEIPGTWLDFIMPIIGLREFSKGDSPKILTIGKIEAAVNICYEDIIPDYIRKSIYVGEKTANVIINATNDSWFGKSIEPEMHMRIASVRAIENRRYLVRVTCTGYSVVVDAAGNIVYRSALYQPEAEVYEVPLLTEKTIYQKGGWLFIYIYSFIIFLILLSISMYRLHYKKRKEYLEKQIRHYERLRDMWYK